MTIKTAAQGADRKELVKAISRMLDAPIHYCGAPTFNYEVDCFTVDREGTIHCSDAADPDYVDQLVAFLTAEGFQCEEAAYDNPQPEPVLEEPVSICVSFPRSLFTETAIDNLKSILDAKGHLIRKALGIEELPLEVSDIKVSFPWFQNTPDADDLKAYNEFICRLCDMARNQKRVTSKETPTDNDKYAFRCFLLRLGFIGAEFKAERKILLRNLSGSSAFKAGQQKEVQE